MEDPLIALEMELEYLIKEDKTPKEVLNLLVPPGKIGDGMRGVSHFSQIKNGLHVMKGKMTQKRYGCPTCSFKTKCSLYPHSNGGCSARYMFYASFLQAMRGDRIPRMKERLAQLIMLWHDNLEKETSQGDMSKTFLELTKIINHFETEIYKLEHGSKVNITQEKKISILDIRDQVMREVAFEFPAKEVIVKDDN